MVIGSPRNLRLGGEIRAEVGVRPSPNRDAASPYRRAGGSSRKARCVASCTSYVDLVRDELQPLPVEHALLDQQLREADHRIARRLRLRARPSVL